MKRIARRSALLCRQIFPLIRQATFSHHRGEGQNAAFTLAEVLITLAIIGVVAAMTMPTLIQNHQKRSLEVATQKFYSMMSQAVKQYMYDEGVEDLTNDPLGNGDGNYNMIVLNNFVTKYLKVVKECDHNKNDCFAPKYKAWDGGETEYDFTTEANYDWRKDYVLADGMVIRIGFSSSGGGSEVYVDVNGKKGPNRVGYDLWNMDIWHDGKIVNYNDFDIQCKGRQYGGCFGHFLENNFKFDY